MSVLELWRARAHKSTLRVPSEPLRTASGRAAQLRAGLPGFPIPLGDAGLPGGRLHELGHHAFPAVRLLRTLGTSSLRGSAPLAARGAAELDDVLPTNRERKWGVGPRAGSCNNRKLFDRRDAACRPRFDGRTVVGLPGDDLMSSEVDPE